MVDLIISAFLGMLNALIGLMPTITLPNVADFQSVLFQMDQANRIIPVKEMMTVFVLVMGIKLSMSAWDGIVWVYHQFWGGD